MPEQLTSEHWEQQIHWEKMHDPELEQARLENIRRHYEAQLVLAQLEETVQEKYINPYRKPPEEPAHVQDGSAARGIVVAFAIEIAVAAVVWLAVHGWRLL
jgi:hypothetical protein